MLTIHSLLYPPTPKKCGYVRRHTSNNSNKGQKFQSGKKSTPKAVAKAMPNTHVPSCVYKIITPSGQHRADMFRQLAPRQPSHLQLTGNRRTRTTRPLVSSLVARKLQTTVWTLDSTIPATHWTRLGYICQFNNSQPDRLTKQGIKWGCGHSLHSASFNGCSLHFLPCPFLLQLLLQLCYLLLLSIMLLLSLPHPL